MDYLREGIGLRAMGQRDPLVEYQREGYELFQSVVGRIREDFTRYIFHVSGGPETETRTRRTASLRYTAPAKTSEAAASEKRQVAPAAPAPTPAMPSEGTAQVPQAGQGDDEIVYETVKRDGDKVGRNDPCPCGSGKKYKRCHGAAA
jgi:preprotein translocase subunit SecA